MARMPGAVWRGPSPNTRNKPMAEYRFVVFHIAEGSFEGTISWEMNDESDISSHLVVSKTGEIAQMLDTAVQSWCQAKGNPVGISVEFEGRTPNALTDAQLTAGARILLWAHREHGVPLRVANSTSDRGLAHHSMGADWGHQDCPGPAIIAQKPEVVRRAIVLSSGSSDPGLDLTVNQFDEIVARLDALDRAVGDTRRRVDCIAAATGVPGRGGVRNYEEGILVDNMVPARQAAEQTKQGVDQLLSRPVATVTVPTDALSAAVGTALAGLSTKLDGVAADVERLVAADVAAGKVAAG